MVLCFEWGLRSSELGRNWSRDAEKYLVGGVISILVMWKDGLRRVLVFYRGV